MVTEKLPALYEPTSDIAQDAVGRCVTWGAWDLQVNGIMEVSRSIGDPELKKAGVIPTPGIERITLCDRDEFLLLGCDGLWRVFDPKDAVDFVRSRLDGGTPPDRVCMELVREAIRVRQAHDNVTALIIKPIANK